jgi:hypothetical protein
MHELLLLLDVERMELLIIIRPLFKNRVAVDLWDWSIQDGHWLK